MSLQSRQSLQEKLQGKISRGKLIISAYLTLGYPDLETSINAMIATANAGADIIEIGIPFTDPMADGPTIQQTNQTALNNGFKVHDLERALKRLQSATNVSIVVMTYGNVIYQYPLSKFKNMCKKYQVDGIIIPDIPPEHTDQIRELNPIFLVAPNTSLQRVVEVAENSSRFLYIVSKLGITGGEYTSDLRLQQIYEILEQEFPDLPRLQGFGIDSVESVLDAVEAGAHGVIIGSKLLKLLGDQGNIAAVTNFIESITLFQD